LASNSKSVLVHQGQSGLLSDWQLQLDIVMQDLQQVV